MGRKKNELVEKVEGVAKRGRGRPKGSKNKPKNVPEKITYIALVVDRSGSMKSVERAALDGINEQINVMRQNAKLGGKTFVTYIQFDDVIETVFANRPASELNDLTEDDYVPRGWTAMLDATDEAITRLKAAPIITEDTAFLVVLITDGAENASKRVSRYQLAQKIKELQATGKWTFTYMLGGNLDLSVATDLGVYVGNVSTFDSHTLTGTSKGFGVAAASIGNYVTARSAGLQSVNNFYTPSNPDADNNLKNFLNKTSTVTADPTVTTPSTDKKDSK